MKRSLTAALFFLVSLISASCSKSVFSNGMPVTEDRPIGHFRAISMHNNVNVKLVNDNSPRLELTCPANLIDKITTEVQGDTLVIKNENKFNWLRSTNYNIDLTVYYDSLREINYASIGDLRCTDPLIGVPHSFLDTVIQGNDTSFVWESVDRAMFLYVNEGSGDIDLNFDCEIIKNMFVNGTSKVILRGTTGYAEHITRSYGMIDARHLDSNITIVETLSTNNVYVWARSILKVQLYSLGNIYYKGNPEISIEACTSDGRLIPL
ncbi:MAG: DUF2807 domain-containing protein [Bacteroidales bacterium]|nr:DUF2807 domain-containing protein [Bacteroidales bacterium]